MTPTCQKAIHSLRITAHINLRQARDARRQARPRLYAYHLEVALACRRDANALRPT